MQFGAGGDGEIAETGAETGIVEAQYALGQAGGGEGFGFGLLAGEGPDTGAGLVEMGKALPIGQGGEVEAVGVGGHAGAAGVQGEAGIGAVRGNRVAGGDAGMVVENEVVAGAAGQMDCMAVGGEGVEAGNHQRLAAVGAEVLHRSKGAGAGIAPAKADAAILGVAGAGDVPIAGAGVARQGEGIVMTIKAHTAGAEGAGGAVGCRVAAGEIHQKHAVGVVEIGAVAGSDEVELGGAAGGDAVAGDEKVGAVGAGGKGEIEGQAAAGGEAGDG